MAAGMPVLVMFVVMGMLVSMHRSLVNVLMAVVAMGHRFVAMLMLMLVLGMAAHPSTLLSFIG